ncbi:MAG: hypothetical protein WC979_01665 [Candidatus Pacearchaeota archaeon]|jgi:hypothetical protein|nr:hypothetical protein [Clostridia bacterium]
MKFPKVLDAKPHVIDGKGNEIIDMTASSMNRLEFEFVDMIMTTEMQAMRPDLLATVAFGNIYRAEDLLKSNEVSNPFAINAGESFLVPEMTTAKEVFKSAGIIEDVRKAIRKQYIDATKAPDTSAMNTALNDYKQREKTALPPNYSKEGDKEMIIKDGVIYFGPNVTRKITQTETLTSNQNLLNKLRS